MTQIAIAREYVAKFPNTPQASLARLMYKENKAAFKDVDKARYHIGVALGKRGNANRNVAKRVAPELVETQKRSFTPYALPESQAEERKPFKLPIACNNVLVISDLHIPYQDNAAISAAFDYGVENKINTVFINGDLLDFYQASRFLRDVRKRSLAFELDACKQFFQALRDTFPDAAVYWLLGNHDVRYAHYLMQKAPELLGIPEFELDALLDLNKYKVKMIDDKVLCKIGKLHISHGHHIVQGAFSPVNAARGVFTKAMASTMIGHQHQVSEHTQPTIAGDVITTWSTGCLCELKPDYQPIINKYAHGFAHVTTENNGNYSVKNIRIYNGKIL